ncbi:hypothetical protein [Winogradskyella aurantiaca]|nr:hypothetical protein [Winogradskyella aurantiaca]
MERFDCQLVGLNYNEIFKQPKVPFVCLNTNLRDGFTHQNKAYAPHEA